MDEPTRLETERWFRRRGVPTFIDERDARRDIWTRAFPFLGVVFLLQTTNAINLEAGWPVWVNALALVGGVAFALGAWAVVNRIRGRRSLELPDRVGVVELAVFVLVPPLIPLVFGGQVGSAGATMIGNLVLLGITYAVISYGFLSLLRFGFTQLGTQFGDVIGVVARALPLLLLFVTFLFINAEAWQVTSELPWGVVVVVVALFFVIALGFAALQIPRQIDELTRPVPWASTVEQVAGTPVAVVAPATELRAPTALNRRQWGNAGLVILVSEGVQVLLVTLGVFAFFTVFGFLAVGEPVMFEWIAESPDVIWTLTVDGHAFVMTVEMLKVATFLAGFSGLYFTVSMVTDTGYREEFLDEIVAEVGRSIAVRDVYMAAIGQPPVIQQGA